MWRFRIHSCIAAVGCEFLLESDPVTAAEKEVAQVIWACIIKFIPNPIMANYLDLEHSIPLLMKTLNERFNPLTAMIRAYNEGTLFKCGEGYPVYKFDEVLSLLKTIYAHLAANSEPPRDSTYVVAICSNTPDPYKYVIHDMESEVRQNNEGKEEKDQKCTNPKQLIRAL